MKYFALILLVLLFSCSKKKAEIINLNGNQIDVFGHAGSGISSTYPTNSFESIQHAFDLGATGSEMDVQLTKDSVLVIFHNETMDGNTTLSGRVRDLLWSEIASGQYDVTPYTNYKIWRVTDLINQLDGIDLRFTFDIKLYPSANEDAGQYFNCFAHAIEQLFAQFGLHSTCFVESQDVTFITTLKSKDVTIKQFIYPQVFETGLQIAQNLDLFGITISTKNISKEQVELAHSLNYWVTIWDVHSRKENREAVQKAPDMIQTDNLEYLLRYLK